MSYCWCNGGFVAKQCSLSPPGHGPSLWKGLSKDVAFNWVDVTLGERKESGWKRERKYETKFDKAIYENFLSSFIRRGLVCPLDHPFYLSLFFSHLLHLTTNKNGCGHNVRHVYWPLSVHHCYVSSTSANRMCLGAGSSCEACSRKGYSSDQKDSQQTAAPPIHTAKICWL